MAVRHINYEVCANCGICYEICPTDVFRRIGAKVYIAYPLDCMTCYLCTIFCPKEDALHVDPERATKVPSCYDKLSILKIGIL